MSDGPRCRMTATGDLMFHGQMAERMAASGDMLWGFRPVQEVLRQGDILFGNLETPISVARRKGSDAPGVYFSPSGLARALKELGYSVVNLAQNHIYDFGAEGVECTIGELQEAQLAYVGIGANAQEAARPAVITCRNGMKVGFLGYTTMCTALDRRHAYVACFPQVQRVRRDIAALRDETDAVVVSCHTGSHLNPYPAPETRQLARTAISAGACVFLGHHSHVPQGLEEIGKGLAVYGLGDFVAPPQGEEPRRRFFVRIVLESHSVVAHEVVPCFMADNCQTHPATGKRADDTREHIARLSRAIADGSSDRLHFDRFKGGFFSQFVTSWIEEFRFGGSRVMLRKLRNLRFYHLQLIWRMLVGRIPWVGRRRRDS